MVDGKRPGEYGRTGRQDALTGPTPLPLRRAPVIPPNIDPAVAAYFEGVVIEQMASVAASLEKTIALQKETKALAELSGKLFKAEQTIVATGKRATRNKGLAYTFGAALGTAVAVFATKWMAYTDTHVVAAAAAAEVVDQKQDPLERRVAANEDAITQLGEDMGGVSRKLDTLQRDIGSLVRALEPPTEVRVPKQKRTR